MESAYVAEICLRLDRIVDLLEEIARKLPEPVAGPNGRPVMPVREW